MKSSSKSNRKRPERMAASDSPPATALPTHLRAQAEQQLEDLLEDPRELSLEKLQAMVHELRVHQIELKTQNEHLRAAQDELETARERLLELYDFAPNGYVTLDGAGLIEAANLTAVGMLGMERERLLTNAFNRFVYRADQERFYLFWRKAMNSHEKLGTDLRLCRSDRILFYARLEAIAAKENKQTVCRMAISDITEQVRAEEALREGERSRIRFEAEEWKQLALEAGGLGAWDQDLTSGRVVCSERACAMLGFSPHTAISWEDIVSRIYAQDREAFARDAERSALSQESPRWDAVYRTALPEGRRRWARFMARTFFESPSGRPLRRTGLISDVTSHKEAEEQLKSQAERLDHQVRERTAQLQEVVSELERFSYTLAHDLRAPLRAISGYGTLLLEQCPQLNPVHKSYLERSNSAAQRMDQLIRDALDYNKVALGNCLLQPVDCRELLRQMVHSYPQFQEVGGRISVEGDFPLVMGNPALLTQCFSNLLNNALKFVLPSHPPAVRINAEDLGSRARLWFIDNGIGIDEEGQKKLFRMFHRLNPSYEGTGVGLAIVKKAAERMGGAVGVRSALGQGSQFWLELDKASVPA